MHDLLALAHLHGELDDRIVARLAVDIGQQVIRLLVGEEAAARYRRQLAGIAEHEDRRAEAHQVLAERLVDHRAFVDDDQRRLGDRALPVDRKHRRDRGLAGLLVLDRLLAARTIDQRMDGLGVAGAARAQHLRRLAGEGRKQHLAIDMLGEMPGKRRLAGSGIAEQAEERRPPFLQPSGNGLQRLVLLRCKLHGADLAGFGT